MEKLFQLIKKFKWTCLLIIAGFLFMTAVFCLGFWKAILLTIVLFICLCIGITLDKKGGSHDSY